MMDPKNEAVIVENILMPHSNDAILIRDVIDSCVKGRHILIYSESDAYLNTFCYAVYKSINKLKNVSLRRVYPPNTEELMKAFNIVVNELSVDDAMASSELDPTIMLVPEVRGFNASDWTILAKLLKTFPGANVGCIVFAHQKETELKAIQTFSYDVDLLHINLPRITNDDLALIQLPESHYLHEQSRALERKLAKDFQIELGIDKHVLNELEVSNAPTQPKLSFIGLVVSLILLLGVFVGTVSSHYWPEKYDLAIEYLQPWISQLQTILQNS